MKSVPGCWDALSALLIERAGFDLAILSGSALSAAALGRPDLGLIGLDLLTDTVMRIRDRVDIELYVDADTGFGGPLNIQHSVRLLERAGADIIQIEDQTFPKRCGHLAGKSVVSQSEAEGRIAAALDARQRARIAARTDAAAVLGVDAAIERAAAFADMGADILFVECADEKDAAEIGRRLGSRALLVCNRVAGGGLETMSVEVLEAYGFNLALQPLFLLGRFLEEAEPLLAALRSERKFSRFLPPGAGIARVNAVTGCAEMLSIASKYGDDSCTI
jgi:2-methylisocitrate lyase-like PEP mutase family enzyme